MTIDTARTIATLRGLTAKFDNRAAVSEPVWPTICKEMQSHGRDEGYAMIAALPQMREWLGERQFMALQASQFVLANREWESSIAIDRNDIEDDRLGIYADAFDELGAEAAHHPDILLASTIASATTTKCLDGTPFFGTTHTFGQSGVQSNLLTYTCSSEYIPTESEFRSAYNLMQLAILGFKRENGQPFYRPTIKPPADLVLWVPPALQETAQWALQKALIGGVQGGGQTNLITNPPREIVALPLLTDTTSVYLFKVAGPLRPFVFQARRPLVRSMKGMDDREFKSVKFMTDARYNVGNFAWHTAVKMTFQ